MASAAPTVTTNLQNLVINNAANINGTINPNGAICTAYFEYGTSTAYGNTTPPETLSGSSSQAISFRLTGMSPGTSLVNAFARVGAFALTVTSKDATLLVTLTPGSYTAQVSGIGGAGGAVLVEVYEVP